MGGITPAAFRRLALALEDAEEGAHGGHPDFRVRGKIFATLGYPDARHGVVIVSPEDQAHLVARYPKVFVPVPGAWGAKGSTTVVLRFASAAAARGALEAAWERRVTKKSKAQRASTKRARLRRS